MAGVAVKDLVESWTKGRADARLKEKRALEQAMAEAEARKAARAPATEDEGAGAAEPPAAPVMGFQAWLAEKARRQAGGEAPVSAAAEQAPDEHEELTQVVLSHLVLLEYAEITAKAAAELLFSFIRHQPKHADKS